MSLSHRQRLFILYAAFAASGIFWGVVAATTPDLHRLSGLDLSGFGLLMALMVLGGLPVILMLGPRMERCGPKALAVCLLGVALFSAGIGLSQGPLSLGICLLFAGISTASMDLALNLEAAELEHETGTRLFSRAHAIFPASLLSAAACTGFAREEGATLPLVFIPLAIGVALLAIFAAKRRDVRHRSAVQYPRNDDRVAIRGPARRLGFLLLVCALLESTVETFSVIFAETALALSPSLAAALPAVFMAGLTLGRLRAQAQDVAQVRSGRGTAMLAAVAFASVATGIVPVVISAVFLAGVCTGPAEPRAVQALANAQPTGSRARAMTLATASTYSGLLVAPPLMGAIADRFGWPALWIGLAFGALLIAAGTRTVDAVRAKGAIA